MTVQSALGPRRAHPLFFPILSLQDLSDAAKRCAEGFDNGDPIVLSFCWARGLPARPNHTQWLDAVASAAGLHSHAVAREVLAEAPRSAREAADSVVAKAHQWQSDQLRRYSRFPVRGAKTGAAYSHSVTRRAQEFGFIETHATSRKIELTHFEHHTVVYFVDAQATESIVVVPMWTDIAPLLDAVPGTRAQGETIGGYYRSSNMRCFPRLHHRGRNQIPHGRAIRCNCDTTALKLLAFLATHPHHIQEA